MNKVRLRMPDEGAVLQLCIHDCWTISRCTGSSKLKSNKIKIKQKTVIKQKNFKKQKKMKKIKQKIIKIIFRTYIDFFDS
jgi:hypothetical protein